MDFNSRILPFYMTHPTPYRPDSDPYRRMSRPWGAASEDTVLRDMEYLQQMYPMQVRRYQQSVARILDKMDFEGSVIYDEYPDRLSLERMTDSIITVLKQEESEREPDMQKDPEKWSWVRYLILVLLYNEVYKRRHGGRRGFFYF